MLKSIQGISLDDANLTNLAVVGSILSVIPFGSENERNYPRATGWLFKEKMECWTLPKLTNEPPFKGWWSLRDSNP
jgi:hypothetical protein